jgi:integrase/recombinase XerD
MSNLLDFLNKYITLYIESKKASNLALYTIKSTNRILERFYDYVADELSENKKLGLKDINKYFLNNYLTHLTNNKISPNSQKLYITIIMNFLNSIADDDIKKYGFISSAIKGVKVKTEQKEKEGFTRDEYNRIVNYIAKLDSKKTFLAQRNSLIVKLLLYCGLRISELLSLKWSDVDEFEDNIHGVVYTILVKGKGNKERYTYLSYDIGHFNFEYLKDHATNPTYIFTSTHGNICSRHTVFDTISTLLKNAGVNKTGLHRFRHTFARKLVDENLNLSTIKELLGHSNITITAQFYAKTNENAKRDALLKKK